MKKLNLKKISETAKKIASWCNVRKRIDEHNYKLYSQTIDETETKTTTYDFYDEDYDEMHRIQNVIFGFDDEDERDMSDFEDPNDLF